MANQMTHYRAVRALASMDWRAAAKLDAQVAAQRGELKLTPELMEEYEVCVGRRMTEVEVRVWTAECWLESARLRKSACQRMALGYMASRVGGAL